MWLNKNDQMVVGMGGLDMGWVKKKKPITSNKFKPMRGKKSKLRQLG